MVMNNFKGKGIMDFNKIFDAVAKNIDPKVGLLACLQSERLLDNKEHFSVTTIEQVKSSLSRVFALTTVPTWYKGTLNELRTDVFQGAIKAHPNIQETLTVSIPLTQVFAMEIKNPVGVVKNESGAPSLIQKYAQTERQNIPAYAD